MPNIPHIRLTGNILEVLKKGSWYPTTTLENIHHVSSLSDYIIIHLHKGERIILLSSMKDAMNILNDEDRYISEAVDEKEKEKKFIRIHRQHIVNIDGVQEYSKSRLYMKDGKKLPVGRVYKKSVYTTVDQKKFQSLRIAA